MKQTKLTEFPDPQVMIYQHGTIEPVRYFVFNKVRAKEARS